MTEEPIPQNIAPTTTAADDLVKAGQRRINLIWEYCQALIAISVTFSTVYVLAMASLSPELNTNQQIAINQLMVMETLILSFYFSRTNHSNTGGVGVKTENEYQGR